MKNVRVLIADDHTLVRAGLRALMKEMRDIEVVGEAGDGREVITQVGLLKPDVVLLDISMPRLNGIEAVENLTREFRAVRVIMVSMHPSGEFVTRALRAGASGYLLKEAAPAELELAIRAVARGETYLSPSVSKHVVRGFLRRKTNGVKSKRDGESLEKLTLRQREILQLIAEGKSSKEIAQILNLGVKTIDSHRSALMKRLDMHSVADLVRYAIRVGLVNPEM